MVIRQKTRTPIKNNIKGCGKAGDGTSCKRGKHCCAKCFGDYMKDHSWFAKLPSDNAKSPPKQNAERARSPSVDGSFEGDLHLKSRSLQHDCIGFAKPMHLHQFCPLFCSSKIRMIPKWSMQWECTSFGWFWSSRQPVVTAMAIHLDASRLLLRRDHTVLHEVHDFHQFRSLIQPAPWLGPRLWLGWLVYPISIWGGWDHPLLAYCSDGICICNVQQECNMSTVSKAVVYLPRTWLEVDVWSSTGDNALWHTNCFSWAQRCWCDTWQTIMEH